MFFFFFQAEDGIRDVAVTGVQTCALPISLWHSNKSSNLSQGITLLVWFTASIAPRDIRRRQVARSTGQSKSSSEFRRHGRLARLLPAQRMGRRLRLLRSFFGSLTVCHHPQIAG